MKLDQILNETFDIEIAVETEMISLIHHLVERLKLRFGSLAEGIETETSRAFSATYPNVRVVHGNIVIPKMNMAEGRAIADTFKTVMGKPKKEQGLNALFNHKVKLPGGQSRTIIVRVPIWGTPKSEEAHDMHIWCPIMCRITKRERKTPQLNKDNT